MPENPLEKLDFAIMDGFGNDVYVSQKAKAEILHFVEEMLRKDFIPKSKIDELIDDSIVEYEGLYVQGDIPVQKLKKLRDEQ